MCCLQTARLLVRPGFRSLRCEATAEIRRQWRSRVTGKNKIADFYKLAHKQGCGATWKGKCVFKVYLQFVRIKLYIFRLLFLSSIYPLGISIFFFPPWDVCKRIWHHSSTQELDRLLCRANSPPPLQCPWARRAQTSLWMNPTISTYLSSGHLQSHFRQLMQWHLKTGQRQDLVDLYTSYTCTSNTIIHWRRVISSTAIVRFTEHFPVKCTQRLSWHFSHFSASCIILRLKRCGFTFCVGFRWRFERCLESVQDLCSV